MSNVSSSKHTKSHAFLEPWKALVIGLLVFFGAQLLAGIIFSMYPLLHHWSDAQTKIWIKNVFVQFWYIVVLEAIVFWAIWWVLRRRKNKLADIGWGRFHGWYIVYALAGFGVYFVMNFIAQAAVSGFVNTNAQQDIGFQSAVGFWQLAATFISVAVLPPLVEETLFRGFLFTAFRQKMTFWITTLSISAIFALPHLFESDGGGLLWTAGITTFTLSIVLCWLREETGSLWPGVLVHAINNGLAFLTVFVLHLH